ncbi:MAG TPA: hypothetical protein VGB44_09580 [Flavobacterium sp.]
MKVKFTGVAPFIFVIGILLIYFSKQFINSSEFYWIYIYGNLSALFIMFIAIVFSIVNTILFIRFAKTPLTKKIILSVLSSSPVLFAIIYFATGHE